jgi:hypothetical protein
LAGEPIAERPLVANAHVNLLRPWAACKCRFIAEAHITIGLH